MIYKIGTYKNGEHFAKSVYQSTDLNKVEQEFKEMWKATDFCPEGTDNEADNAEEAWNWKHFSEDTNNVAVFECESESEPCKTDYRAAFIIPNIMK